MFSKILSVFLSVFFCALTANIDSSQGTLKLEPSYRTVLRDINDSLRVKCYFGNNTETDLTWTDPNGEPIPVTINRNIRKRVELILNSAWNPYAILILENLTESDNGSYVCNHPSQMSASFSLDILEPITFDQTEAVQFATIGTKYTIKCTPKLRGNDKLKVYWKINNRDIDYSRMTPINHGLLINKVHKNDTENDYRCGALDAESRTPQFKTQIIKLIVLKENFTESQLYCTLGQYVLLPCKASSKSAIFKWYDTSNQEIIPSHEKQIFFHLNSNGKPHVLRVVLKDGKSFGTYTCITESGNRTFGHKFLLGEGLNENTTAGQLDCSPFIPIYTENPDIGLSFPRYTIQEQTTPAITEENYNALEWGENEPQKEATTITTKKSSTITSTTKISQVTNEDGSVTVTRIITSEETIIETTGPN